MIRAELREMREELAAMGAAIIRLERGSADRGATLELLRQHLVRLGDTVTIGKGGHAIKKYLGAFAP